MPIQFICHWHAPGPARSIPSTEDYRDDFFHYPPLFLIFTMGDVYSGIEFSVFSFSFFRHNSFSYFWPHHMACRNLFPSTGIKCRPTAVKVLSWPLNCKGIPHASSSKSQIHWTHLFHGALYLGLYDLECHPHSKTPSLLFESLIKCYPLNMPLLATLVKKVLQKFIKRLVNE